MLKNEIEEIKNKSNEIKIDYKGIVNQKDQWGIFETIITEAINFQFKNINNVILLSINCIMPSTLILFLEKRDFFIQTDFPKLILLLVPINLILVYSVAMIKYSSGFFNTYILRLKYTCLFASFYIKSIKLKKRLAKLQQLKLQGKNIKKKLDKARSYSEEQDKLGDKINLYIEQCNIYKNKYTMDECFKNILYMNILMSFSLLFIKLIAYAFNISLPDKYLSKLVIYSYVFLNCGVITKVILSALFSIILDILDILFIIFKVPRKKTDTKTFGK